MFNTWRKAWYKVARPKRVVLYGQRLDVSAPEISPATRRRLYRGRYLRVVVKQLTTKVEPNDVVVDVGAGIGVSSLIAASIVGPEHVIAIEPDARAAAIAAANFAINDLDIELVRAAAVGDASPGDTIEFYPNAELGNSSIHPRAGGLEAKSVNTVAVGTLISERQATVLLVDAEGIESALLTQIEDFGSVRLILVRVRDESIGYEESIELVKHLFDRGFALDFPQCRGAHLVFARR